MNYRLMFKMVGVVSIVLAIAAIIPMFIALALHEDSNTVLSFGIMALICSLVALVGALMKKSDKSNKNINTKSGILTVGITWIYVSLIGTLPYVIGHVSGINNFADALFESVSGFTTTGASLATDINNIETSVQLWRALSQWFGGMGILVFVTALLGKDDANASPIFNAETPGPTPGKIVSKLRSTARILYAIYIVMTFVQFILLLIGTLSGLGDMSAFDCLIHSLTTASTGGFSTQMASIAAYNSIYYEIVIDVFMVLFMINFNLYYLILIGRFSTAIRDEELRSMMIIIVVFIVGITSSLCIHNVYSSFAECLRYGSFETISVMSTTGYALVNVEEWPLVAQILLVGLMIVGGSSSSTAGGLKVMRFVVLSKSGFKGIRNTALPNRVSVIKMNGKPLDDSIVQSIKNYFLTYLIIFVVSFVIVSMLTGEGNFLRIILEVSSAFNNVGPGDFTGYGVGAKLVLTFDMLAGRLELFPMLLLFYPKAWKKF